RPMPTPPATTTKSAPSPSTDLTAPEHEARAPLPVNRRVAAAGAERKPTNVRFHATVVCGGQTLAFVENGPKLRTSFTVDWAKRAVVVEVQLPNGWLASCLVPFENVAGIQLETVDPRPPVEEAPKS
ncbi:MAG TPA: hypothetical protein VMI75_05310, partial [Polyangiaceae bacterium]|nr:hypothetical protein [Polyangiaceae bacterium]